MVGRSVPIAVTTLTDGGQTALQMAERVAGFLGGARRTLDLALYDVELDGPEAAPVSNALRDAAGRGVAVRVVYNVDHPGPIPVPPPPQRVPDLLETLPVSCKAIPGVPDLMHHKYAVAKVTVADDTVFLGSFNLSRSGEFNAENVLEIEGAALADRLAAFVDEVRARYPRASLPDP